MKGRRIILTGASEGIGRALALELAARGARVALAARDRERLESLAQECRARGGEALAIPTDVTNQQDLDWLVTESVKTFGGIDVVIHNAGITMWSRFDALTDLQIFERLMEVNYLAPVRLTALTLPHLRAVARADRGGRESRRPDRRARALRLRRPASTPWSASSIRCASSSPARASTSASIAPDFVVSEIHKRAIGPDGEPLGASPMMQSKIMTAEECARRIARAMEKRQRLLLMSTRGKWGRWLKLLAPSVIDRIAARAIRQRH